MKSDKYNCKNFFHFDECITFHCFLTSEFNSLVPNVDRLKIVRNQIWRITRQTIYLSGLG